MLRIRANKLHKYTKPTRAIYLRDETIRHVKINTTIHVMELSNITAYNCDFTKLRVTGGVMHAEFSSCTFGTDCFVGEGEGASLVYVKFNSCSLYSESFRNATFGDVSVEGGYFNNVSVERSARARCNERVATGVRTVDGRCYVFCDTGLITKRSELAEVHRDVQVAGSMVLSALKAKV